MKYFHWTGILLLCFLAVDGEYNEDCQVEEFYQLQHWDGEEVIFYVYVPEDEVIEIIITYHELGFFTRFYFSPSQKISKIIESEKDDPQYLAAMQKFNDWLQFKILSQAGKINVIYEPNTNETVSINHTTKVKELSIKSKFISFCRKGKPSWLISNGNNITMPIPFEQEIPFYITSVNYFSPVFYMNGQTYSLFWENGLTFNHFKKSLEPMTYYMILEARSDIIRLHNEGKSSTLLEVKFEKRPQFIQVSSIKGEYLLTLSVQNTVHTPEEYSFTETPIDKMNTESSCKEIPIYNQYTETSSRETPRDHSAKEPSTSITVIFIIAIAVIIIAVQTPIICIMRKEITNKLKQNWKKTPLKVLQYCFPTAERMDTRQEKYLVEEGKPLLDEQSITNIIKHGIKPHKIPSKHVVVDFFSPNVAREMHTRHLRSAIIGDSISRVLEFMGHKVTRLNHLGDWGIQLGMLIAHLNDSFPDYANNILSNEYIQNSYKDSKIRFENDEEFKRRANNVLVKLQSNDPEYIKGWTHICDASKIEFDKVCSALDIKINNRSESFYHCRTKSLVKELDTAEHLQDLDDKKIMFGKTNDDAIRLNATVLKFGSAFTYNATDLACLKQRIEEEKADRIVYVVDHEQSENLKSVLGCGNSAGFYDPSKMHVDLIEFGEVLGEDEEKLKSSKGDPAQLMELLKEGAERAENILKEKGLDNVLTSEEFANARNCFAYGCIKYADLSHDRARDYIFSFDRMLDAKGNTAIHLFHVLIHIKSITKTAEVNHKSLFEEASKGLLELTHEREWNLARTLVKLPDILLHINEDLKIKPLCDYLYEVSSVFTEFNDELYGESTEVNKNQLILCQATVKVMEKCFNILGIRTVENI